MAERPDLSEPLMFSKEDIIELTGLEKVTSKEDVKTFLEGLRNKEPEKVIEKQPFEFKDDFIKGAYDYYDTHGNLAPYIENNKSYDESPAEELFRIEFKEKNPKLSDAAINHLVKKEMEKFSLPEDSSEEDKNLQKELLDVRVGEIRNSLIEKQKKFNAPETPSFSIEKWSEEVKGNDVTKELIGNKTIKLNYGEDSFNYEVENPESLVEMTIDNTKFFKLFQDEKGNLDYNKWYRAMAYVSNPKQFEEILIKHGQAIGTESVANEIKNPEINKPAGGGGGQESLLDAFANRGKLVKR